MIYQYSDALRPGFNKLRENMYTTSNDIKRQVHRWNTRQCNVFHCQDITMTVYFRGCLLSCLKPQVSFHQLQAQQDDLELLQKRHQWDLIDIC